MKVRLAFQLFVLTVLMSAYPFAQSGGFSGADITRTGVDFTEISGFFPGTPHTPEDPGQEGCTWYSEGAGIFTAWDHGGESNHFGHCLWAMYTAELTPGFWRIGLNAINRGSIKSNHWYPSFQVLVEIIGDTRFPQKKIIHVPASDDQVHHGYQWFHIQKTGIYGVTLTWLNDKSECFGSNSGGGAEECFDVNIMIDSVFMDRWRGWIW
ncbi:MAG: hypothetical protein JSU96_03790 [Acidobacteriota bacterium]|nr:MAG: hypothetical protein JSU96_03790 [Acidobacteriota bacterium]